MNNHTYSTNLNIHELFDYIKINNIEIVNIQIKDKITFNSSSKYHSILIKNSNITYLYTTNLLGMLLRIFKIYKLIPIVISILLLLVFSNIIIDIEVIGESDLHKDKIIELLNIKQLPYISSKNSINNKLKILNKELNWYEVIQKGSKIIINYLPRINNVNTENNKIDLVASKDAIVASFDVLSGNKVVKVNQKVSKGDILVSQYILENPYDIVGKVYGYTFEKVEVVANKNDLPISFQRYILLLKSRMNIKLDKGESIVKEISLQFSEERDTIRIVNFYVLYEMISIIGESNG